MKRLIVLPLMLLMAAAGALGQEAKSTELVNTLLQGNNSSCDYQVEFKQKSGNWFRGSKDELILNCDGQPKKLEVEISYTLKSTGISGGSRRLIFTDELADKKRRLTKIALSYTDESKDKNGRCQMALELSLPLPLPPALQKEVEGIYNQTLACLVKHKNGEIMVEDLRRLKAALCDFFDNNIIKEKCPSAKIDLPAVLISQPEQK